VLKVTILDSDDASLMPTTGPTTVTSCPSVYQKIITNADISYILVSEHLSKASKKPRHTQTPIHYTCTRSKNRAAIISLMATMTVAIAMVEPIRKLGRNTLPTKGGAASSNFGIESSWRITLGKQLAPLPIPEAQ
jgi:hypothetical protein